MNQISQNRILQLLWYTLPITIIGSMVLISKSTLFEPNASKLAPAIILDLIFTLPLIYFFIIRKKSIPKTTIVPVFIIGIITASIIIPIQHQSLLDSVKFWILPFVELFVMLYLIFTIRKSVKAFKKQETENYDFHSNIKIALADIMPQKAISFVAMEVSAFYYSFIKWKSLNLAKNEYTYHRESGTRAILIVLLFLIGIETFVFHLLLESWSTIFAWVLTGLSIYSGFQILGILKSLSQRPVMIKNDKIVLRYGIIAEGEALIQDIKSISGFKGEIADKESIKSFSPLGDLEGHNVIIEFEAPFQYTGFYGFKKEATTLALFIDDPKSFILAVEESIELL
ncbi:MAG: hypothetical protein AB8B74_07690 [Crocinitomicaceae bacterium]